MPLIAWLRGRVRSFLGMEALPTREMLNALELRERQRHEAVMGVLNRIEQRIMAAHIDEPRTFTAPTLDWSTVEAIALQSLIDNPQKES